MRLRAPIIWAVTLLTQLAASSCIAQRAPAGMALEDAFAQLGGLTNYLEFPHDAATLA